METGKGENAKEQYERRTIRLCEFYRKIAKLEESPGQL